jgi:uncharacterized membrane protein YdbT with pleckstrin-like domain
MALNYVLLTVTAVISIASVIDMKKGSPHRAHPFHTVGVIVVFVIVLIATLTGTDYITFRYMIESALRVGG